MEARQVHRPPLESAIPPSTDRKHWIEVWRPQPGEALEGLCLNQELAATFTHWVPALSGKIQCPDATDVACGTDDCRWYGYMPVLCQRKGRVIALEVTKQAASDCPRLSNQKIPLRGKVLKIGRHSDKGKFGRCWATVTDYSYAAPIPPSIDPEELLRRVFRFLSGGPNKWCNVSVPASGREGGKR